ncbi:MAG: hypothetical protein K9N38_10135 [Candidatus Marinimicrobia bacterium]|nr:hypothetical protein [Candidatus Neomarinimicrobiota bacterium]
MKAQYASILTSTMIIMSIVSCSATQYLSQTAKTAFAIDAERNEWE